MYEAFDERLGRPVAVKLLDEAAAATADPAARRRFESESRTAASSSTRTRWRCSMPGSDQGNAVPRDGARHRWLARASARGRRSDAIVGGRQTRRPTGLGARRRTRCRHHPPRRQTVERAARRRRERQTRRLRDRSTIRRDRATRSRRPAWSSALVEFVSPEQARGEPLGPATDIFSLGVTLYEAATGIRPMSAIERPIDSRLDVRAIDPTIDAGARRA